MTDPDFIAEREIKAVHPDGSSFTIQVRLGRPYQVDTDQWACPVALDGLYKRLVDQHGVDSWQALQLAYRLALELLADFIEKGGRLFLWEEETEVSLNELRKIF